MIKIGIISDTHNFIHKKIIEFLKDTDEIWHAGDIGDIDFLRKLQNFKPLKVVYGNIDDWKIRSEIPEIFHFETGGIRVMMKHIAGPPGKYNKQISQLIQTYKPGMLICGHSHILKIMYDAKHQLLYLNPGSAGITGFHKNITAVRFKISESKPIDVEIIDIERSSAI